MIKWFGDIMKWRRRSWKSLCDKAESKWRADSEVVKDSVAVDYHHWRCFVLFQWGENRQIKELYRLHNRNKTQLPCVWCTVQQLTDIVIWFNLSVCLLISITTRRHLLQTNILVLDVKVYIFRWSKIGFDNTNSEHFS